VVFEAESEFNAFDAFVTFDPTRLEFVATSPVNGQIGPVMSSVCSNFFHQFVPHPDNLEIHLSLMCANTFVTGPGVIYQVRFRALSPIRGATQLGWGVDTEFYRAGFFVRPVEEIPMTLFVGRIGSVGPPTAGATAVWLATPRPNPYQGTGPATLAFSLPGPDRVRFEILDTQGRRVAERAPEDFGAGSHSVAWSGLRLEPGRYLVRMSSGSGAGAARTWAVVR
jgi:hypothetical protein